MYVLYGCWGYFLNAFNPSIPLLREDQHTSATISALHALGLAFGLLLAGIFGTRLVSSLGRFKALSSGFAVMCLGTALFCTAGWVSVTIGATVLASAGGCLGVNVLAASLSDHHGHSGPRAISEATGVAGILGAVAPIVLSSALLFKLPWQTGLLATIVLVSCAALLFKDTLSQHSTHRNPLSTVTNVGENDLTRLSKQYWKTWIALLLCCSLEFSFTIWSSDMLRIRTGAQANIAALSVTAVIAGLALGRFVCGHLSSHYPLEKLLFIGLGTIAAGFTIFWFSTTTWLSFTGLLIAGFGIGPMFPISLARLIRTAPQSPDQAISRVALGLGPAVGIAPFAIGILVDHFGIANALLLIPALILMATAAIYYSMTLPTAVPAR
jgi:MFS family permease